MKMDYPGIMTILGTVAILTCSAVPGAEPDPVVTLDGKWQLAFRDDFDGTAADLDANWEFQNGPSGHILCSRWRENARLSDGILRLIARKEKRGGQDWTAASCWTKKQFKYGYFECRYRYLPATGTNNSFWIMTRLPKESPGRFEIDINEGHMPNEVNMNLHNWSGKHWARGSRWYYGSKPGRKQADAAFDLGQSFHVYSLLWTEKELVHYFDGKPIHRTKNDICHGPAPVWLSLAIMKWAGPVTDTIHGKSMDVDYVRVWQLVE